MVVVPFNEKSKTAEYLLIIDLEATCEDRLRFNLEHEIIEFPALIFETRSWKCVSVFHTFLGQFKGLPFQPFAGA